jgi:hypothetical protein
MWQTRPSGKGTLTTQAAHEGTTRPGRGWVAFAGVYLLVAGGMNVVWGLVAFTDREVFVERDLVWATLTTWGWLQVAVGAIQLVGGTLVLARTIVGRVVAAVMALAALFANFLALGGYPAWSILAIVANGLVLWAVTVHGEAFD